MLAFEVGAIAKRCPPDSYLLVKDGREVLIISSKPEELLRRATMAVDLAVYQLLCDPADNQYSLGKVK